MVPQLAAERPTVSRRRALLKPFHLLVRQLLGPERWAWQRWSLARALNAQDRFAEALVFLDSAHRDFTRLEDALGQACCDWQRGVALRSQEVSRSATLLEVALDKVEALGEEEAAVRIHRDLAIAYNLLERFDEAAPLLQEARAYFAAVGDPVEAALCDLVEGARIRQLTRYQEAQELLTRALTTFRVHGEEVEAAKTLFMRGLVRIQTNEFQLALDDLHEASAIFHRERRPLRVANCRLAEGRVLAWLGRLGEASVLMDQARVWFEGQKMAQNTADSLLNLGNVAFFRGNYALASDHYERARAFYQRAEMQVFVARCEQNLGLAFKEKGRIDLALDHLHRAIRLFEEEEIFVWAAHCHYGIAELYARLRETETARFHLTRARHYFTQEALQLRAAQCEALEGQLAAAAGKEAEALTALKRAQTLAQESGSGHYISAIERLLGAQLLEMGDATGARAQYAAVQARAAATEERVDEAFALLGMGLASIQLGEREEARRRLQATLAMAAGVLPEVAWQAHAGLGDLARAEKNGQEALTSYRQALRALYGLRLSIPAPALAEGFVYSVSDLYERSIELALELNEELRALEMIEDYKAQVLKRTVFEAPRYEVGDPYLTSLLEREAELRAGIVRDQKLLLNAFEGENWEQTSVPPPAAETKRLQRLEAQRQEHRRTLHQIHAHTAGRLDSIEPFRWQRFLAQAQETLSAPWRVLAYYWLDEELVILHADASGIRQAHIQELTQMERMALELCTSPAPERRALAFRGALRGMRVVAPVDLRYQRLLYKLLIPDEVAALLTPATRLLIVPHGSLHHLPFSVLQNEEGFLVEQATISQLPSLAVLEGLARRAQESPPQEGIPLLIGIDSFAQDKPPLSSTVAEIRRLRALYGDRSELLQNAEATAGAVLQRNAVGDLQRYGLIHLASHAYLDAASDSMSAVALQERDLTTEDITQLRLNSAVVVLSACQSGLGALRSGDESLSLAQAFLIAGARTVTASLWHVEDVSTLALMVDFHAELHRGGSPAVALARAQRAAITRGDVPFAWGAFIAIGMP